MGGVDPRIVDEAWRSVHFARRAAQQAHRAAEQAATAAAQRERLLVDAPPGGWIGCAPVWRR